MPQRCFMYRHFMTGLAVIALIFKSLTVARFVYSSTIIRKTCCRGVNVFPTQIEEQVMATTGLAPYYQIELVKEGRMDAMHVHV